VEQINLEHKFAVNAWAEVFDEIFTGPRMLSPHFTGHSFLHFLGEDLPSLCEDVSFAI
jgi:hypothetical protein